MRKQYGDKGVSIHFIQQMLNENYNSKVRVSGEYYKHFDMKYGFAHFIAKYLDQRYPLLDTQSINEYKTHAETGTQTIRNIEEKPISLLNYFLCNNKGKCLTYDPSDYYSTNNKEYRNIYNQYMVLKQNDSTIEPADELYIVKNDLPLFSFYNDDTGEYSVNNNIIFELSEWDIEKEICEIDDFIASYLFGRTITPHSSMEEIYYAQRLLIRDRVITRDEKGIWCIPGQEGTEFDMTQTVINYQKQHVNKLSSRPLFITGYFDIFTEAQALKELGDDPNGICGL